MVRFRRLYDLVDNKLVSVEDMFTMGGGWLVRRGSGVCRRLFAWEEELVRECVERLTSTVLQVGSADHLVWHLHSSIYVLFCQ